MGVARVEPIKGWAIEGETKWIAIGVRRIQFDWVDVRHCQGSQSTRRGLRDVAGEQGFAGTPFVDVRRSVERAQPCVIFTPRGVRRAHGGWPMVERVPGHMVDVLLTHLRSLNAAQLATVLRNREETLVAPWPAHISELAVRLSRHDSVMGAYAHLSLPHLEVLGAITLARSLGSPVTVDKVAKWLGGDVELVQKFLDDLADSALAWTNADGDVVSAFRFPLIGTRLGPPLRTVLEAATLSALRPVAAKLKVRGDGTKLEVINRLSQYLSDADTVIEIADNAPPDERDLILECAELGAEIEYMDKSAFGYRRANFTFPGDWAVARGLLWPDGRGYASMPLEIAIALRGTGWRLVFHPEPPSIAATPVSVDHVQSEAASRLLRMLELTANLLDLAAAEPIPLLKSEQVGVRTVKQLAKDLGADVEQVVLALQLATDGWLLEPLPPEQPKGRRRKSAPEPTSTGLIPGASAGCWLAAEPPERAKAILDEWWIANSTALLDPKAAAELRDSADHVEVRQALLKGYSEVAEGSGIGAPTDIAPLLLWRAPLVDTRNLEPLLAACAQEAELLGLLAFGAATSLGRSIVDGGLGEAVAELVSGAHTTAVIGADLTAVVFGPPTPDLSYFLDNVATRESGGTATMWRFTPDSVRSAFDNGATKELLLDGLGAIAESEIPQALEYLINDVARTHGKLGVVELGCAIVSEDPTVLLELVATRKLAKLELASLAPTVIASKSSAADVISTLRAAGYAPVLRAGTGTVQVDTPALVSEQVAPVSIDDIPSFADPDRHARHLIDTADRTPPTAITTYDLIRALRERGGPEATWNLAEGKLARITHDGSTHVVHSASITDQTLTAWSVTTDRYEDFPLDAITVSEFNPAEG